MSAMFAKVIAKLSDRGLSQMEIARFCGCSQAVISKLLREEHANPRFWTGWRLLKLYEREYGEPYPVTNGRPRKKGGE